MAVASAKRLARPKRSTARPPTTAAPSAPAPAKPATTAKVVTMPSLPP
jgi:hypothetical protein